MPRMFKALCRTNFLLVKRLFHSRFSKLFVDSASAASDDAIDDRHTGDYYSAGDLMIMLPQLPAKDSVLRIFKGAGNDLQLTQLGGVPQSAVDAQRSFDFNLVTKVPLESFCYQLMVQNRNGALLIGK